jgi:hypothetical protein
MTLVACLCSALNLATAATIPLTSLADNGPGTLRGALQTSADGDTIDATALAGRILLTSGELLVNKSVNIVGPGPASLSVDGNSSNRVFHIAPSAVVSIFGLTITNGSPGSVGYIPGTGIYNEQGTLTLRGCDILGNVIGSGIYNEAHAAASISDCNFIANNGGSAGALENLGTLVASNCCFLDNWGGPGGGLANDGDNSHATVLNCSFRANRSLSGFGGGLYNRATIAVTNCFFLTNSAADPIGIDYAGGGGFRNDGDATISNTVFRGNSTYSTATSGSFLDIAGGAINNFGTLLLVSSTIQGNSAQGVQGPDVSVDAAGGGVFNAGAMQIIATTLFDNLADGGLSGIYNSDFGGGASLLVANSTLDNSGEVNEATYTFSRNATLTILNSTFSGEQIVNLLGTLQLGGTIFDQATLQNSGGTVTSLGFNLSSDGGGGILTNATDQINTHPMLGPLQNNGGPTWTHALLCGSPAIDRGRNFSGSATDQRGSGFARTFDDPVVANATGGDATDVGALELQSHCHLPPIARCRDVTVQAGPGCLAHASIDNGSFDPEGDPITLSQSPPGPYPMGTNVVTLMVTNLHGGSNSCSALVIVQPALATRTVTSLADNGPGTLRTTLAMACPGDTITFSVAGTILLTNGELLVDKNIIIQGPGPANLAVDGNLASRVFRITNAADVRISGLTITRGQSPFTGYSGGGIYYNNVAGTLTLSNCNVTFNSAGGIFFQGPSLNPTSAHANLSLLNCVISHNRNAPGIYFSSSGGLQIAGSSVDNNSNGTGEGGGIYFDGGPLDITNSTVSDNDAGRGGGAYILSSSIATSAAITNSLFTDNFASIFGGAVYSYAALAVTGSTLSRNRNVGSGEGGGAIYNGGQLAITASTISSNTTAGWGGGIVNHDGATVTLTNSTLNGNSAQGGGGGIGNGSGGFCGGTVRIANSTMSGNFANFGGGILNFSCGTAMVSVVNSTFSGNWATNSAGDSILNLQQGAIVEMGSSILNTAIAGTNILNSFGTFISLGYNLTSDNGGGLLTNATDQINTDPMLGRLQNNGGPTLTHALLCGSPAIDKGKNFSGLANDQRGAGFPRTFDDPAVPNATGGDGTDIGALEVQGKASASVMLGHLLQPYDGTAKTVTVATVPPGLAVVVTYNGSANAPTNPGSYIVVGAIKDPCYQGISTNTLVIAPQLFAPARAANGEFQFSFLTAAGVDYTILSSTTLTDWMAVLAFRGAGGMVTIIDPNTSSSSRRFYRLVVQP